MSNDEKSCLSAPINWYPGHMAKAKKDIAKLLPLVDIVYELVDARIPYSSRIEDIKEIVKNKPHIIVMTKADLCDLKETEKWEKKYEKDGYKVVLINSLNNKDYKKVLNKTEEIINSINTTRIQKGLKEKEIRAMVIGIPNVGKSTFINAIVGKKVANVGNKPGITTNLVWLKTKTNILLLDTPGVLYPKIKDNEVALNLASFQAIKNEILDLDEVALHILKKLDKYYPNILIDRYSVAGINEDISITYDIIGKKVGALCRGGEIDYDRVSSKIVNDVKDGIIKNVTFDRWDEVNE